MSSPEPQITQSETVRKHKEFLFPAVATYYQEPLALVKGEGFHVWDDKGDKYLDCFGGVLTVSVGHANPRVNEAIINQVNTISHTSTLYGNKPQSDLAEKLAQITPGRLKKSFFTNSGTEADDTAVHATKLATGRHEIVVLRHAYSGRSATSLSAMGHAPWRPLPDAKQGACRTQPSPISSSASLRISASMSAGSDGDATCLRSSVIRCFFSCSSRAIWKANETMVRRSCGLHGLRMNR